ncbi:hypothetical protein JCGZ_08946 [Jatropha curcas]|uniref:Pollen Ole e 1 allergen and extensin family protein n=2 Tax=Jatropha curcas TaxID=180498 RepID=A0A067KKG1_JATCU|nr:hypothetical protein JCGZ_08946 [Jatropha curcas]
MTFNFLLMMIFLQRSSSMAEGFEFSSREEMVRFAGYGEEKLSTVLITGSILCEACLHSQPKLQTWPLSGALVAINCDMKGKWIKASSAQAVTDEYGDFQIDLPSHLHAIPNLESTCSVKVLRIPKNSACKPAFARKHKALTLSSAGDGIRVYTAEKIKFLDLKSRSLKACLNRESNYKQVA